MLVALLLAIGVVAGPASADPTMTGKEARKLFTKMGCKEVWAYTALAEAIWRGQDSVSASEIDPEWMQDKKFMKIDGAIDNYFSAKSDCGFTSSSRPVQGRLVADR